MRKRTFRRFSPRCDVLEARRLLLGYTPAQITAAYALNAISFMSPSGTAITGNGAGQTIALIETYHDPNIQASLDGFDARYGLPNITLDVVNLAGNLTDGGWAGEESLDVEWAHAIAPGANIEVVEAAPGNNDAQSFSDFITAVQTASQTKGVSVVSMSLGSSEFSGESSSDSAFSTAGITYVASSGDGGTVEWPASAPDVLAVGGTTLRLSGAGYGSELGWAGTGGGLAVDETEPSYQEAVQSTGQRSTPDVSFEADPSTGVAVYYVPPNGTGDAGNWGIVGGTSVGAPAWAGILAIANQGRAVGGQPALSGGTQTVPALYSFASSAFRKVSLSFGINFGTTNTAINTPNYNTQTGLGSPVGSALVADLVAISNATDPIPPGSPPTSPPTPPATPPPAPTPPPFTIPTPIPVVTAPVAPITHVPAPLPAPVTAGPTPATPAPAAAPRAVPKKKAAVHAPPKHHAKTGHLVSRRKATAKPQSGKKTPGQSEHRA
jgi:subtilase family serine protease